MSNTYRVKVAMTTYLETVVIADSETEAMTIAADIDGSQFDRIHDAGGWEIIDAVKEAGNNE